jgi:cystathionine gamma-synthase
VKPETFTAQALHAIDAATGAIVPPLHTSTTYARDAAYELRHGRTYTRDENPTHLLAEALLAKLEGGAEAMTFSSGMTAATSVFRALCKPGDHIVASRACYFAMRAWLATFSQQWSVEVTIVATTDLDAVRAALRPNTRVIWVETPANPTWDVSDIAAIAALKGTATLCVDSTAATPVLTHPLALGADLVMHSATKYLAGHSDVLAGALVTRDLDARWQALRDLRHVEGCVLGPFDAWLLLRGMRTLFVRVERQCQTAQRLAERLSSIASVRYPGLPTHAQHAIAARQMTRGFGGMMAIQTGGGAERALEVVKKLRVWVPATSLGGVESLVEHRRTAEGVHSLSPPDLLRLSVGLEDVDDLYDDLAQALA